MAGHPRLKRKEDGQAKVKSSSARLGSSRVASRPKNERALQHYLARAAVSMAAAAVLRRLAGRALRRPSSSFPHALLGKQPLMMNRSPPVENITPRRLYSSDGVVIKAEANKVHT